MDKATRVGAVLYDPKVSVIWDIIRDFFEAQGSPIDVAFYSTYDLQVGALVRGDIDVAWNSPLAWLDAQRRTNGRCRAIAMRDTDRDRVSHIVARKTTADLADLRGRTLALGASDSPQATLIPLGLLRRHGLAAASRSPTAGTPATMWAASSMPSRACAAARAMRARCSI